MTDFYDPDPGRPETFEFVVHALEADGVVAYLAAHAAEVQAMASRCRPPDE